MKKLAWIIVGLSLSASTYAWNGSMEDMNTMNDNMSGSAVRVVKSYPGMFRGWTDNAGFKYGGHQTASHIYSHKKNSHKKRHSSHRKVKQFQGQYTRVRSGVCIAKCSCDGQ